MNLVRFSLIWALFMWKLYECSVVMDIANQTEIKPDYCPYMELCNEGTHVMCMYYNPNKRFGPTCNNAQNVTMTKEIASKFLDVTNAIRSKLALGKEKGKGGILLPKGYGIMKLRWDSELATFAQVLANQCILRHDLCRATKKFPDPGQAVAVIRFTNPGWMPISHSKVFSKEGLTHSKVNYAVTQALKSWYSHKSQVTKSLLESYPDWTQHPEKLGGRLYLAMVMGASTHMGCGISAFTEYSYHNTKRELSYNSVEIVCNFSSRPRKGKPLFPVEAPTEIGTSIHCGCPEGFEEDAECLCSKKPIHHSSQTLKTVSPPSSTVEDTTTSKATTERSTEMTKPIPITVNQTQVKETSNIVKLIDTNHLEPDHISLKSNLQESQVEQRKVTSNMIREPRSRTQQNRRLNEGISLTDTRNQYLDQKETDAQRPHTVTRAIKQTSSHSPKSSIFSKVQAFELRSAVKQDIHNLRKLSNIRKDVSPRKDFSNSERLLSSYIKNKIHQDSERKPITSRKSNFNKNNVISIPLPVNISDKSISFNRYTSNKFNYPDFNMSRGPIMRFDIKNSNEEADRKLMALLDNLEQEAKRIDLDVNGKEIFDAKIRKIYGSIVGKPKGLRRSTALKPDITLSQSSLKEQFMPVSPIVVENVPDINENSMEKGFYETENRIKDIQTLYDPYSKPMTRKLNSIRSRPKSMKVEVLPRSGALNRPFMDAKTLRAVIDNNKFNAIQGQYIMNQLNQSLDPYYNNKIPQYNDYKIYAEMETVDKKKAFLNNDNKDTEDTEYRDSVKMTHNDDTNIEREPMPVDVMIGYKPSALLENSPTSLEETRKRLQFRKKTVGENVNRNSFRKDSRKKKNHYESNLDTNNNYYMTANRRKYYQEKIDNMERKVHEPRNYRKRPDHVKERAMRLMRTNQEEHAPVRSRRYKDQPNPYYTAERPTNRHDF